MWSNGASTNLRRERKKYNHFALHAVYRRFIDINGFNCPGKERRHLAEMDGNRPRERECAAAILILRSRNRCRHAALPDYFLTVATDADLRMEDFPLFRELQRRYLALNNSTPIACSSARMRRLNAVARCCD